MNISKKTAKSYEVFLVNDFREVYLIDILLNAIGDEDKIEGDFVSCYVDTRMLRHVGMYNVKFCNDIEDTTEYPSSKEKAKVVKVVKEFLEKNPLDSINYGKEI